MDGGIYEAAPYAWPRWCHGNISRQVAEQRLFPNHNRNPFLIRQRDNGEFVLSIRWDTSGISHSIIRKHNNGFLQMDGVPHSFHDLNGVVADYIQVHNNTITPIAADGSAVLEALTEPRSPMSSDGYVPVPVHAVGPSAPPMPAQGFGAAAPSRYTATPTANTCPTVYPVAQPVPQQAGSPWQLPTAMPTGGPPPAYPAWKG